MLLSWKLEELVWFLIFGIRGNFDISRLGNGFGGIRFSVPMLVLRCKLEALFNHLKGVNPLNVLPHSPARSALGKFPDSFILGLTDTSGMGVNFPDNTDLEFVDFVCSAGLDDKPDVDGKVSKLRSACFEVVIRPEVFLSSFAVQVEFPEIQVLLAKLAEEHSLLLSLDVFFRQWPLSFGFKDPSRLITTLALSNIRMFCSARIHPNTSGPEVASVSVSRAVGSIPFLEIPTAMGLATGR